MFMTHPLSFWKKRVHPRKRRAGHRRLSRWHLLNVRNAKRKFALFVHVTGNYVNSSVLIVKALKTPKFVPLSLVRTLKYRFLEGFTWRQSLSLHGRAD